MIPHLWFRFMDTDGEFLFLRVTSQVAVLAGELVRLEYLLATAARVEYQCVLRTHLALLRGIPLETGLQSALLLIISSVQCRPVFLVIHFAYQ